MVGRLPEGAFADTVTLVTGADGGIGGAICEALATHGGTVVGGDVSGDDVLRPGRIGRLRTDVTSREAMDAAVAATIEAHGRLDLVVGCAGIVRGSRLTEVRPADWQRSFAVNVDGMLHLARAAHPHLCRSPAPAAVAVASLSGTSAYPGGGGYGPSKAALISLSRQLAVEWGRDGIRVNVVCPGPTRTPMLLDAQPESYRAAQAQRAPLGRLAEPQEVADAVLFLLSSGARAVTGQVLAVDCGMSQTLLRGIEPAS